MARVQLDEHTSYPFEVALVVRMGDLNSAAHLGHDRLLALAQQARAQMLRGWELEELDLGDGRTGLVIADVAVVYQGEAFVHDELSFALRPTDIGARSFRLAYRVRKSDGAPVARMEIGLVAFDYPTRCAAPLPARLRAQLTELCERK